MKLSYCISTLDRANLLDNSLKSFTVQNFPKEEFEIIVVDDNSIEDIKGICAKYKGKINLRFIRLEHVEGIRDCTIGLNLAIRRSKGEVIAPAHPEITMSFEGLNLLYWSHFNKYPLIPQNNNRDMNHLCVLLFALFLPEGQFSMSDYKTISYPKLLEKYSSGLFTNLLKMQGYNNFVCMSMKREDWFNMGGFYEFRSWGSMDPDHNSRRQTFGITDVLIGLPDGICLHQWHPVQERAKQTKEGKIMLESRPWQEANLHLPFLSEEHDQEMSQEIVFEEYWPYEK